MNELIPSEGQIEFGSFRSPEQHLKEARAVGSGCSCGGFCSGIRGRCKGS